MGPGRLGVDVVGRDGRHAAPVVDAGADQLRQAVGLQVGRRLDVHGRPQHEARHRDGPGVVLQRRLRGAAHARAGLGAEVLDDHLLDVPVALVHVADRQQRLDALGARLADADQDAGGERHACASGGLQGGEPHGRHLVGRAEVRAAALRQPLGRRLQHDALRHRHLAQAGEPRLVHHARIEVRQQARLFQHQRCRSLEIFQRRLGAERAQSIAGRRVTQLRLVAQREQRLLAAGGLAPAGDVEHGLGREVVRLGLARRVRERAVVAHVPAQLGQRDEHLLGEAHVRAVAGEAEPLRQRRERGEVVAFGQRHRLERGQAPPALGGCKRLSDAGRRHGSFPWGLDCSVSEAAACGARKA